jgi:hypothetical protein
MNNAYQSIPIRGRDSMVRSGPAAHGAPAVGCFTRGT